MGFEIDFTDFDKTFFKLVEKSIPGSARKGLAKAAFEMLEDADNEAPQTPFDKSFLRGSRKIEEPKITKDEISIKAGYTSKYAAYQHEGERKDGTHKVRKYTTARVSQPGPKFLQKKMVRHKKKYIGLVAEAIEKTKV